MTLITVIYLNVARELFTVARSNYQWLCPLGIKITPLLSTRSHYLQSSPMSASLIHDGMLLAPFCQLLPAAHFNSIFLFLQSIEHDKHQHLFGCAISLCTMIHILSPQNKNIFLLFLFLFCLFETRSHYSVCSSAWP